MRYKRMLLVQCRYDSEFSNALPAGIGYLSEFLDKNGLENDTFDLNVRQNTETLLHKKISDFKPDLVGFSMMSLNYKYNYDIINRLKLVFPDIAIAAGGAHISTMRDAALRKCDGIDYGVVLEGEYTLLDLMKGEKDLPAIKGLIYREGDKIAFNGERPFIQDLDSVPYPRYRKFDKKNYSNLVSLFSSRGCPFECIFCPVALAIGRRFVARSAKNVVDEMEYHHRHGYRNFSFRDDNFTLVKDRVYEICDEIERRNMEGLYLMCDNGVRADKIDRKLLKRMKEVGFRMIGLGVESGSDRILKVLKKSETVRDIRDALKAACELGYIVEIYFLIGSPGETWEDFEESVRLALSYPAMLIRFYHILPYPNTELFEHVKGKNYLLRNPEEYLNDGSQRRNTPFFSTPEFPYELRKKAFEYAHRLTTPRIRKARRDYSMKNSFEELKRLGLHPVIARPLSRIYSAEFVREGLFGNPLLSVFKSRLKQRESYKQELKNV